jgi:hypothetical protein
MMSTRRAGLLVAFLVVTVALGLVLAGGLVLLLALVLGPWVAAAVGIPLLVAAPWLIANYVVAVVACVPPERRRTAA